MSGWLAFAMGLAGMFVLMALWVALVEMPGHADDDAEFISRPQGAEAQPPITTSNDPISDYR